MAKFFIYATITLGSKIKFGILWWIHTHFKLLVNCEQIFWSFTISWLSFISLTNTSLVLPSYSILISTLFRAQEICVLFSVLFYSPLPNPQNMEYLDVGPGNKIITLEGNCKCHGETGNRAYHVYTAFSQATQTLLSWNVSILMEPRQ